MADPVTLRTRKFIRNQLLSRRQMVVYVLRCGSHSNCPSLPFSPLPFLSLPDSELTQGGGDFGPSDVLHPNRPNVSKDDLRGRLAEVYKVNKDQVTVFGFRTRYGGGMSTGFALIYDSHEAMKKFEPYYRLVRIGAAPKIEKPSRQQRMSHISPLRGGRDRKWGFGRMLTVLALQGNNERTEPRNSEGWPRRRVPQRTRRSDRLLGADGLAVICLGGGFARVRAHVYGGNLATCGRPFKYFTRLATVRLHCR